MIARQIIDLMGKRPHIDLEADTFTDSYAAEIVALELEYFLLYTILNRIIIDERLFKREITSSFTSLTAQNTIGLPLPLIEVPSL